VVFLHYIFSLLKGRGQTEYQLPQAEPLILDHSKTVEFHHKNPKVQLTWKLNLPNTNNFINNSTFPINIENLFRSINLVIWEYHKSHI
jgi:hypothetical protein